MCVGEQFPNFSALAYIHNVGRRAFSFYDHCSQHRGRWVVFVTVSKVRPLRRLCGCQCCFVFPAGGMAALFRDLHWRCVQVQLTSVRTLGAVVPGVTFAIVSVGGLRTCVLWLFPCAAALLPPKAMNPVVTSELVALVKNKNDFAERKSTVVVLCQDEVENIEQVANDIDQVC